MQYQEFYAVHAETGRILPHAKVTVRLSATGTLAAVYNAEGVRVANPMTASSAGLVGFAVADGEYTVQFVSGTYTAPPITKIVFFDPRTLIDTASGVVAQANAARDAALLSKGLAASVADGLAKPGIAVGDFFSVPTVDDIIFYRVDSSTVATEVGRYSRLLGSQAQIADGTKITVNLNTNRISVVAPDSQGGLYVSRHGFGYISANQDVEIAYAAPNYLRQIYVTADGTMGMAVAPEAPPSNAVVLGVIYGQQLTTLSRADNFELVRNDGAPGRVVGVAGQTTFGIHLPGQIITVDMKNHLIATSDEPGFVATADGVIGVLPNQVVAYDVPQFPAGMHWVHVDPRTGLIGFTSARTQGEAVAAGPGAGLVVVGWVFNYTPYQDRSISTMQLVTPDNVFKKAEGAQPAFAKWSREQVVTVNFQTGRLKTSAGVGLAMYSGGFVQVPGGQDVEFLVDNPPYVRWVAVHKYQATIEMFLLSPPPSSDYIVIAVIYAGNVYHDAPGGNIVVIGPDGMSYPNLSLTTFDPAINRAILPAKMYFLPGKPMTLFRAPCFATFDVGVMDQVKFWLDTAGPDMVKRFQPIAETVVLDPEQLGSSFDLVYRHQARPDERYINTIERVVAPAGALTGKTVAAMTIGDSLTQVGMAHALRLELEAQGATVNILGTFQSPETEGESSEGRGYWNYRTFIGMCNNVGGNLVTRAPTGTATGKFENPFLRLATATDKANHPTWCFRNTGAVKELNYAEDANRANGDFYIFDFAWYRAQHSVPAPTMITIALSTNDIQLDVTDPAYDTPAKRLAFMRLGLGVIVRQIHADLPNVAIGIIPAPAWSSTTRGETLFRDETSVWIENCMTDVEALKAVHPNLHIVPVWPFMSEDLVFPYAAQTPLSAVNKTRVSSIVDWVHFTEIGRKQYARVTAAWAANVL